MHRIFAVHTSSSVAHTPSALRADRIAQFRWFLVALVAAAVVGTGIGSAWAQASASAAYANKVAGGQILVGKNKSSSRADFENAMREQGGHSLATFDNLDVDLVKVPPGKERDTVDRLKGNKHVAFAELDVEMDPAATVNDPSYGSEWHLPKINAPTAWDSTMGGGVTIAILDTGVDGTHPDLLPQMVAGWNLYSNNSDTADVLGHGTAVAGAAAAAANNGTGVAGVAGGAKIMPLRISDSTGYALWSTTAQAITYAADHGARVVNLSFEGAASSSTIQSAASYLRSKGGVLFVAAGNTGALDNTAATSLMQIVSATNESDLLASFSSFGSFVTISAPGNNILTTARGGGYMYAWGTSLATPVAAATAALIIAKRPDFTSAQIDSTLKSTAVDLGGAGTDIYFGAGRVNAAAAVAAAGASSSDKTAPTVAIASPTGGTVSGVVPVSVSASDNVGVTRVDFRVNGGVIASDTSAPFTFSWNSAGVPDGAVSLTAVAYDAAGNSATSAVVTVTASNAVTPADTTPPTVAITSPSGGATVSGTVTVGATAIDNKGVSRVDFRVNGATVATTNTQPFQFAWSTASLANGPATLTAVAYDAAGNSATSAPVGVTVSNGGAGTTDSTPPTVTITNPVGGALVLGLVSVKASATDNSGAAGITLTLYIDGAQKASATGGSLSYNWNTKKVSSGTHTLVVSAADAAGNTSSATVQVTRK